MENDLIAYIQQLELIGFFAGYPLIYASVSVIAGRKSKPPTSTKSLATLLPYAYALTATLFLGMVLKNMEADFSIIHISEQFHHPYLQTWALLGVVFWIPAFSRRIVFSLLHSLLFCLILIKDFYLHITSSVGSDIIMNDMKIYTDSILLNMAALAFIFFIHFIVTKSKKRTGSF